MSKLFRHCPVSTCCAVSLLALKVENWKLKIEIPVPVVFGCREKVEKTVHSSEYPTVDSFLHQFPTLILVSAEMTSYLSPCAYCNSSISTKKEKEEQFLNCKIRSLFILINTLGKKFLMGSVWMRMEEKKKSYFLLIPADPVLHFLLSKQTQKSLSSSWTSSFRWWVCSFHHISTPHPLLFYKISTPPCYQYADENDLMGFPITPLCNFTIFKSTLVLTKPINSHIKPYLGFQLVGSWIWKSFSHICRSLFDYLYSLLLKNCSKSHREIDELEESSRKRILKNRTPKSSSSRFWIVLIFFFYFSCLLVEREIGTAWRHHTCSKWCFKGLGFCSRTGIAWVVGNMIHGLWQVWQTFFANAIFIQISECHDKWHTFFANAIFIQISKCHLTIGLAWYIRDYEGEIRCNFTWWDMMSTAHLCKCCHFQNGVQCLDQRTCVGC